MLNPLVAGKVAVACIYVNAPDELLIFTVPSISIHNSPFWLSKQFLAKVFIDGL